MTSLPGRLLCTLCLAFPFLVSRPVLAANWKAVNIYQVQLLQYLDGSKRFALYVSEDGQSFFNVYVISSDSTEEDRALEIALTAIEFGFKALIDLQSSPYPGLYITSTVIVQNVPSSRASGSVFPQVSRKFPGGLIGLTPPKVLGSRQKLSSDWKLCTVAQVGHLADCLGTEHLVLTLTGSELPGGMVNVYFIGADQTEDNRAFHIALVALRKKLSFVVDLASSSCPGVYQTSHVVVQNVPAP